MKRKIMLAIMLSAAAISSAFALNNPDFADKRKLCQAVSPIALQQHTNEFYPEKTQVFDNFSVEGATHDEAESCGDLFDLITPDLIGFYETYFAKEAIITGLKSQKLDRLTETYSVSRNKLYTLLIIQNVCNKNGGKITLSRLSEMSNGELIRLAKSQFEQYIESLSDDERNIISQKFKELSEQGKVPKIGF